MDDSREAGMRLILARHGETESNRERLALGRQDVSLNEKGRLQAQALADSLKSMPLAAVYSSPLRRAYDTAQAIADRHDLLVRIDDDLTEMDVGEMDGLSFEEMRQRHGDFLRSWLGEEAATLCMPGGESLQDVQNRAWAAVQRIVERHPEETVVAVSHNFTIHVLLCRVLGLPISDFRRLRHDLAAISTLDIRDERIILVQLNDICHLEAQGLAETPLH